MLLTALSALILGNPIQTIDGIKPVFDPAPKFAQALAKRAADDPAILQKADPFTSAFFIAKAKVMSKLVNTKYTAAQMGICGTILTIYDEKLGGAIKSAADRITKGAKDFDSLTDAEVEAIGKANLDTKLMIVGEPQTTAEQQWQFFAGTYLGMLAGYTTMWHISPKQPSLLKFISDGAKGCAEHAEKREASSSREISAALAGFSKFSGKTIDEATAREIGAQIEATLKAATLLKYRW
jgi:hypothetical protein